MELKRAERSKVKLKLAVSGVSGTGKTKSSLLLASGMVPWDKIAVIDSENGSASLYAHLGPYQTIQIAAPFTPDKYVEALKKCVDGGMEVVIVDSMTHVWSGQGGIIDQVDTLGGKHTDWGKVTPRLTRMLELFLQAPVHVIATMRRKTDYDIGKDAKGKTQMTKVGTKVEFKESAEYEFSVHLSLNMQHLVTVEKDRTELFAGQPEFIIDADVGKALVAWANKGV